jgi:hypothetical protein
MVEADVRTRHAPNLRLFLHETWRSVAQDVDIAFLASRR